LLEEDILKKLTQNETVYLNSPISIKWIGFIFKNLPKKKIPGPVKFMGQFNQRAKK
jgi:hypothetical protein